jgi:hypothetical protein
LGILRLLQNPKIELKIAQLSVFVEVAVAQVWLRLTVGCVHLEGLFGGIAWLGGG